MSGPPRRPRGPAPRDGPLRSGAARPPGERQVERGGARRRCRAYRRYRARAGGGCSARVGRGTDRGPPRRARAARRGTTTGARGVGRRRPRPVAADRRDRAPGDSPTGAPRARAPDQARTSGAHRRTPGRPGPRPASRRGRARHLVPGPGRGGSVPARARRRHRSPQRRRPAADRRVCRGHWRRVAAPSRRPRDADGGQGCGGCHRAPRPGRGAGRSQRIATARRARRDERGSRRRPPRRRCSSWGSSPAPRSHWSWGPRDGAWRH